MPRIYGIFNPLCGRIGKMIGVLLAAGLGTRLRPLTYVTSKPALPVYDRPMFFFGLKTIIDSGISEVIIISNPQNTSQLKSLLNYFEPKNKLQAEFVIQKNPNGMVDGLISAQKKIGNQGIMVYPADNISSINFSKAVKSFKSGAMAFLTEAKEPFKYGCPIYSDQGELMKITEKPKQPQSNWVVTAPYLFDKNIFKLAKLLKPSKRGELEITDLLNLYLDSGLLKLNKNTGKWFDCGSFEDLLLAGEYVRRNQAKFKSST